MLNTRPIPTLESLLEMVGGRVPLLLEVKESNDIWRWMPALKRALAGYDGPFGVMSFDARIPRLAKTNLPEIRRGLVIRGDLAVLRRRTALWLADPNFVAVQLASNEKVRSCMVPGVELNGVLISELMDRER